MSNNSITYDQSAIINSYSNKLENRINSMSSNFYKQFQSMGYKGSYNEFLNNHEIVIAKPVPDIKKELKELVSLIGEFKTLHNDFVKYYC